MVIRSDDSKISSTELLWRRILDQPKVWFVRLPDGDLRPSSAAFLDRRSNEVSVHRKKFSSKREILKNFPDVGIAQISAGYVRELELILCYDPIDTDKSHSLICNHDEKPLGKSQARKIAKSAVFVVNPSSERRNNLERLTHFLGREVSSYFYKLLANFD